MLAFAAIITDNPTMVGLIVALPSVALGYMGYRRSQKADKIAQQVGVASAHEGTIENAIEGQRALIESLQDDNKMLRDEIRGLRDEVRALRADLKSQLL